VRRATGGPVGIMTDKRRERQAGPSDYSFRPTSGVSNRVNPWDRSTRSTLRKVGL
jgi:hypothetical protein